MVAVLPWCFSGGVLVVVLCCNGSFFGSGGVSVGMVFSDHSKKAEQHVIRSAGSEQKRCKEDSAVAAAGVRKISQKHTKGIQTGKVSYQRHINSEQKHLRSMQRGTRRAPASHIRIGIRIQPHTRRPQAGRSYQKHADGNTKHTKVEQGPCFVLGCALFNVLSNGLGVLAGAEFCVLQVWR